MSQRVAVASRPETPALARHYRPDVDGLRAVAIGLVVLYHVSPALLPGGYIGVDIFFVISGFVVTASTLARGEDSIWRAVLSFWQRRLLRIYPALLACTLATLLIVMMLIAPFPLVVHQSIVRSGMAATLGAGNLYLHRSQLDYFSANQSFNPFLHTWSLGIEEQFYLVFSVIVIALPLAVLRARKTGNGAGWLWRMRLAIMAAAAIASAVALWRNHAADPIGSYYLLQYRFWELGIGSLLALVLPRPASDHPVNPVRLSGVAASSGQAVVLAVMVLLAACRLEDAAFSVATIALATCGAAAIIALGSLSAATPAGLLANPVMVTAGLLSYSLYLWHWPVFIAFGLTVGMDSVWTVGLALMLVGLAATASYVFIEQPFRSKSAGAAPRALAGLAGLLAAIVSVAALAHVSPGLGYLGSAQAWTTDWLPATDFAYAGNGRIMAGKCDLGEGSAIPATIPANCIATPQARSSGQGGAVPSLLLVGDSLAFADWAMLTAGVVKGTFGLQALSHNGCNLETPDARKSGSCRSYWLAVPRLVGAASRAGDAILIAASRDIDSAVVHEHAVETLTAVIGAASAAGASVIIQAPLPHFPREAYLCTRDWFRRDFSGCAVERDGFVARRAAVMAGLQALQARHRNVHIWDPLATLCPTAQCGQFAGDKPMFRDRVHLSYFGAASLADEFAALFRRVTARPG